ncbi:recombination regulator RecX [Rhodococcus triatomae]|nr:recombination regulator RecX [Rhodococcus triatomae]QNG24969.1 recombination regulator RecX [Rhodococcus triatomae]
MPTSRCPTRPRRRQSSRPLVRPEGEGGTEAQAKEICLRLLADRARSRGELADRLRRREFAPDVVDRVLDRLTEVGLIDDADFAREWVRSRHTYSGKGKRALAVELRRKGIGPDDAAQALDLIDREDERARAGELVDRKLRSVSLDDREKATRRLVGMLARRGFPPGMCYEVVKERIGEIDPPR